MYTTEIRNKTLIEIEVTTKIENKNVRKASCIF